MKSHTVFVISAATATTTVTSTPTSSTAPFIRPFPTHGSAVPSYWRGSLCATSSYYILAIKQCPLCTHNLLRKYISSVLTLAAKMLFPSTFRSVCQLQQLKKHNPFTELSIFNALHKLQITHKEAMTNSFNAAIVRKVHKLEESTTFTISYMYP
jgi:hypothetical protein